MLAQTGSAQYTVHCLRYYKHLKADNFMYFRTLIANSIKDLEGSDLFLLKELEELLVEPSSGVSNRNQ